MTANPNDAVRMKVLGAAVDLGWTPPGWRSAPYPPDTRLVDRIADWAFGVVWGDETSADTDASATFRLCDDISKRRALRPSSQS